MSERILRLKPDEVAKFFAEGKMEVVNTPAISPDVPHIPGDHMIERASDILGIDFLGPQAIEKAFGVKIPPENVPEIPFSTRELERAKELNQFLILRIDRTPDGIPLTIKHMGYHFSGILYKSSERGNNHWYELTNKGGDEDFYEYDLPRTGWALVSKEFIPGPYKNFSEQTQALSNFLKDQVFRGTQIPPVYRLAIEEFEAKKTEIKLNQIARHTPVELVYDLIVYFQNTGQRLLAGAQSLTSRRIADDSSLVRVGSFTSLGIDIGRASLEDPLAGVCLSRIIPEKDMTPEKAKDLLGKDFLGIEAVRYMETRLKAVGVDVEFVLNNLPPIPYDELDLQFARQNGEMLVLRPNVMIRDGKEVPLSLIEFKELFLTDPLDQSQTIFTSTNPWYHSDYFARATNQIKFGWSLVKKDLLDRDAGWESEDDVNKNYVARLNYYHTKNSAIEHRTALAAVYDTLIYYVNTGERLLPDSHDRVSSYARDDFNGRDEKHVKVGNFTSKGLAISKADTHYDGFRRIPFCPSR